ncbi:PVR cell adhesion molecule related 2 like [Chanos chanos]|uniref:Nectin cell adhesion molecule 3 n=1 Tax=Chanos chanos TaxID=29144 RepID=A0A6J2WUH9_CHACN|nr:poliovirus receptor-like [Chanos chanos]
MGLSTQLWRERLSVPSGLMLRPASPCQPGQPGAECPFRLVQPDAERQHLKKLDLHSNWLQIRQSTACVLTYHSLECNLSYWGKPAPKLLVFITYLKKIDSSLVSSLVSVVAYAMLRKVWPPVIAVARCVNAAGVWTQTVRVVEEMEAYPNTSVLLRCEFVNAGSTKLTQVSWIFEPSEGERDNIAVYHPTYGESFPDSPFKGRVKFSSGSLQNPSITIENLRMSDAGKYICEYATYPSGNEHGTTTLIMLAKPRNSASPVTVRAGSSAVVVARCEAAQGKPAATITWVSSANGNYNSTSKEEPDGTVTVKSEYRLVPTPADNGREISCEVTQRTQDKPQSFPMKLTVEYPPSVKIEGYDENWYMGRADVALTCQADANPVPTAFSWTVASGPMPPTVRVEKDKLYVMKVDESVNTTFVCEVKNSLGSSKNQVTVIVIESSEDPSNSSVVAGAVLGSLLAVLLVSALVVVLVMRSRRQQHGYSSDGEQGVYGNKVRLFGGKKTSKNGAGSNNNGPIYTYREGEPGALTEKPNDFHHMNAGTPAAREILLSSELDDAHRRKFDTLNDSVEEEEERYDGFDNLPPRYHIRSHEEECGVYLDDDMESQRDGSFISRTAIYV